MKNKDVKLDPKVKPRDIKDWAHLGSSLSVQHQLIIEVLGELIPYLNRVS